MRTNENNMPEAETREEDEIAFDFWSDEGARRFNEVLDEGSAYISANLRGFADSDMDIDDQQREYRDPELYDPEEETLTPGKMELIYENSYIM
jgi:hypothetical protein